MFTVIISLVILEKELLKKTKLFIDDLKAGMSKEDELIVVDNGSTLGRNYMQEIADIYVHTPKPIGYGSAFNLGIKLGKGDYFLIPNNDMRISSEWRKKLLEKFEKDEKIGIVSCHGSHMIETTGTAFNGIFWSVRKKVIEDIGYFDYFKPREGDDSDFCLRAIVAGWEIETAEFFYDHPERKSTHNQKCFNSLIKDSNQWQQDTFKDKWGFEEKEWYKKALEMRNK